MVAGGDKDKQIWVTEVGSPSSGDSPNYTEKWQANTLMQDFAIYRTYNDLGLILIYDYKDEGSNPLEGAAGECKMLQA
jgi:exo-beta-1,3-glucanase (GH17 family)